MTTSKRPVGRPKKPRPAVVKIITNFDVETAEGIDALAAQLSKAANGAPVSRAEAVRQLVRRGLERS